MFSVSFVRLLLSQYIRAPLTMQPTSIMVMRAGCDSDRVLETVIIASVTRCRVEKSACRSFSGLIWAQCVFVCVSGEVWPVLAQQRDGDVRTHSGHAAGHGGAGHVQRPDVYSLQGTGMFLKSKSPSRAPGSILFCAGLTWLFRCIIAGISCAQNGSSEKREVRQFQFTAWPDHGVPEHPTPFLAFLRRVKSCNPPDAGPMVVHCRSDATLLTLILFIALPK